MNTTDLTLSDQLRDSLNFLVEMDKLKTIERHVFINQGERRENSAEHSWHTALAIWVLKDFAGTNVEFDLGHALKLALIHDICEIDTGDISAFSPEHKHKHASEKQCMERLAMIIPGKNEELMSLWLEYVGNTSIESQWVKVADRLLPFLLNLASEGKAWKKQKVRKSQVLAINQVSRDIFPELHQWILRQIDLATEKAWLIDP